MKRIYIYPKIDLKNIDSPNPYIVNTEKVIQKEHIIINQYPNSLGVLDLFRNIFRTDVYFFNWIEELYSKRYGKIQCIFFIFFIGFVKVLKKNVVWVLHNKSSHEKKTKRGWSGFFMKLMINESDLIITHSYCGVKFIKDEFPKHLYKVKYFIHPIQPPLLADYFKEKEFDFFIWGTIYPYKGVIEFLQMIYNNREFAKIKILIAGICPDRDYEKKLRKFLSKNVVYKNKFFRIEQIAEMAKSSKFVLFTYNSESVLSSGTLMDSIRMGVPIIGPNRGAFKDLSSYRFISTYDNFNEVIDIYKSYNVDNAYIAKEMERFCLENNWEKYGEMLNQELSFL